MAIKDEKKLKLSRRVATVWVVVSLSVAVIIGIVGYSMAKENIIAMFGDASSAEALIVTIAAVLSEYGAFFAILAGLVLAGILAATMSTADVQLLAAASAIAQNIIRGVFGVELDDKKSMIVARVTVLAVAICGVLFALDPTSSTFRVVRLHGQASAQPSAPSFCSRFTGSAATSGARSPACSPALLWSSSGSMQ